MTPPHIEKNNEDLLRDFEEWLAKRGGHATIFDAIESGNHLIFAGMILKNFRKAAREAVFDRFKLEARQRGFSDANSSTESLFFMIDRVAEAWSISSGEKVKLLGLDTYSELDALRGGHFGEITPDTLERGAILLDIFIALNTILPPEAANGWLHSPNSAPLFGGRSALSIMIEGGVKALRNVRSYLRAVAVGN